MADLLLLRLSRRLQPPCAAFLILAAAQLLAAPHPDVAKPGVRGALAAAAQIPPERS